MQRVHRNLTPDVFAYAGQAATLPVSTVTQPPSSLCTRRNGAQVGMLLDCQARKSGEQQVCAWHKTPCDRPLLVTALNCEEQDGCSTVGLRLTALVARLIHQVALPEADSGDDFVNLVRV